MSPDTYFIFTLAIRMAVAAAFLLAATITAERAGPLAGGLVATLPVSAGPVYLFLALDHDAHFIAQGALGSLVTNGINIIFSVTYALLAQRRSLTISFLGASAVWAGLAFLTSYLNWTLSTVLIWNVVVFTASFWIVRPLRNVRVPPVPSRWYDFVLRAVMVALLVGFVVGLSFTIGPRASGGFAVFPIVLGSIMIILHRRIGGPATAAILANAAIGLGGFGLALLALYLTAERLGSPLALSFALVVSIGCNLMLYLVRRHGARASA